MYLYLYLSTYLIHLFDHLFIYWRVMFSLSHSLVSLPILLLCLVLLSTHPIHPFYSSTHLLIYLPIHLFPVLFPVITHPSICCLFIYALIHLYIPSLISILHLFVYLSLPCVLPTWAKQILNHVLKQLCPKELCMHAHLLQCCPTLCNTMDCSPSGSFVDRIFPGKNTGVGYHALLQGILLTPHCRLIDSLWLSHQGSPQKNYNVSQINNFKFSNSHILKSKK